MQISFKDNHSIANWKLNRCWKIVEEFPFRTQTNQIRVIQIKTSKRNPFYISQNTSRFTVISESNSESKMLVENFSFIKRINTLNNNISETINLILKMLDIPKQLIKVEQNIKNEKDLVETYEILREIVKFRDEESNIINENWSEEAKNEFQKFFKDSYTLDEIMHKKFVNIMDNSISLLKQDNTRELEELVKVMKRKEEKNAPNKNFSSNIEVKDYQKQFIEELKKELAKKFEETFRTCYLERDQNSQHVSVEEELDGNKIVTTKNPFVVALEGMFLNF